MKYSRSLSVWIAGASIVAGMLGGLRAENLVIQIRRTVVPAAVARLSTAELIDELQNEAGETIDLGNNSSTVRFAALEQGFAPVDAPPFAMMRNMKRYLPSPVMTELVSRGLASLPLLLEHLSDSRPTRCAQIVRFGFGGPGGFADKYDSRYREPDRQPKDVNLMTQEKFRAFETEKYVLRVGDLCYYAAGQIVNRRLNPVSNGLGRNNRALTINSPVENAALAAATRADWQGLTATEHEAILRKDAQDDGDQHPQMLGEPALKRLLFYYPEAGKKEAERRLAMDVPLKSLHTMEWLVYDLNAFDWPSLVEALHRLFERAIAIETDDIGQRFIRDQLVLEVAQRIAHRGFDQEISPFLAAEIAWWEGWRKETAAAPWFGQPGKMAALSNLHPHTKRWCADAAAVMTTTTP